MLPACATNFRHLTLRLDVGLQHVVVVLILTGSLVGCRLLAIASEGARLGRYA